MARILVTGAAGFIGSALCRGLVARGHAVLGLTRRPAEPLPGLELLPIGDIGPQTDWSRPLEGIDTVIHLANRAHGPVRNPPSGGTEALAAAALAGAAVKAGVRRLVHMSSIKAMGELTRPGAPFRCTDRPLPRDAYGRRKLAIERALQDVAQQTRLELVILRPPLVYGPDAKANFRALLQLVASGLPLPFAGIDNRRSLVFLGNLVDVTARACAHPDAAGRVLLVRDDADLSTPGLVRALAAALGRPARLFAVPEAVFAPLRPLPILGPLALGLTLSLQIDDRASRAALDWRPPVSPETGLAETARDFLARL